MHFFVTIFLFIGSQHVDLFAIEYAIVTCSVGLQTADSVQFDSNNLIAHAHGLQRGNGGILHLSVCLSVCLSVFPQCVTLIFRIRPSTAITSFRLTLDSVFSLIGKDKSDVVVQHRTYTVSCLLIVASDAESNTERNQSIALERNQNTA